MRQLLPAPESPIIMSLNIASFTLEVLFLGSMNLISKTNILLTNKVSSNQKHY
jgi:hypothetical protein